MTGLNKTVALTLSLLVGGALLGCGDSGTGGAGGDDPAEGGNGGTGATGAGNEGGSGSGAAPVCGPDAVDMTDACEVCSATNCTDLAIACCEAEGCLDIIACVRDTMCDPSTTPMDPATACYNLSGNPPGQCQTQIDTAGIEVALQVATPLGECAQMNCATECGFPAEGGGGAGM
jgi:hypothetical protein